MAAAGLVQSVLRACDVLETVGEHDGGVALHQLAAELGLKMPTLHNLARTLVARGYLAKSEGALYRLGERLPELLARQQKAGLLSRARGVLSALAQDCPGAILNLSRPMGAEVVECLRWDPERRLLLKRDWQPHNPYGSATGLLHQAYVDGPTRRAIRQRYPFTEFAAHLWESEAALDAFLADVRARAVCVPVFPRPVFHLVAVPVLSDTGELNAALGLAAGAADVRGRQEQCRIETAVREAAVSLQQGDA